MSTTFQEEKLADIKDEIQGMLVRHWEEIALNKEVVPLDPDWDMYSKIDEIGMLSITTGRKDGKIIGYWAYFIVPNFHYKSLRIAECDAFYVDKEYRKGRFAIKLLAESEKNVIARGVNKIINKTKEHFKNQNGADASSLFKYAGYTKIENIHAKLIKED